MAQWIFANIDGGYMRHVRLSDSAGAQPSSQYQVLTNVTLWTHPLLHQIPPLRSSPRRKSKHDYAESDEMLKFRLEELLAFKPSHH